MASNINNINEIINDFISRDSQRIRQAGAEIIRNSQNESSIKPFIPFLNEIKKATQGLELGGAFAPNNRFYKFPIEIIEFHQRQTSNGNSKNRCTCELYLSETYDGFNPEIESENSSVDLNIKIKGNHTHDYEVQCLKCQKKYHVSERHYHFIWWKWELSKYERQIQTSGNNHLDNEFQLLIKIVRDAVNLNNINKDSLTFEKNRLTDYRMKLADNKKTAFIETKCGWNEIFDELINEIELKIKNKT